MNLSCSCCEDGVPVFVPALNRVLLSYPDKSQIKRSDIHIRLNQERDYKNKRQRNIGCNKRCIYNYLSNHYNRVKIGKLRKDGVVSYNAPKGIIIDHSKLQDPYEYTGGLNPEDGWTPDELMGFHND